MSEQRATEAGPISFGEKLASSQIFADLFRDGMALVEETASYLDGPGRLESKKLHRAAALTYASINRTDAQSRCIARHSSGR